MKNYREEIEKAESRIKIRASILATITTIVIMAILIFILKKFLGGET